MRKRVFKYDYQEGDLVGCFHFIRRGPPHPKRPAAFFLCRCGKEYFCRIDKIKTSTIKSCGCATSMLHTERLTTHGQSKGENRTVEYSTWNHIWQRTSNVNNPGYKQYNELGVTVCEEWRSFDVFFRDMGKRPSNKHSIDRVDNNKGYYKENCEWRTCKQQQRNRRDNIHFTYNGETKVLSEWAEITGMNYNTLTNRLVKLKWPVEKALTLPIQIQYKRR